MRGIRYHLLVCALTFDVFVPGAGANTSHRVYYIGNSHTRNVPLERLQELFESQGTTYDYGMQLGGGHRLEQHLSKHNHGNKPADGCCWQMKWGDGGNVYPVYPRGKTAS